MTVYEVGDLEKELARLTAALHKNRCHPDWSYIVVPAGGMTMAALSILDMDAWQRCPETELGGGDECWRRRKQP